MNLNDVEAGKKYKCDYDDGKQDYAIVLAKGDRQVRVTLGDEVNEDSDPGIAISRLGTLGAIWVEPSQLHEL